MIFLNQTTKSVVYCYSSKISNTFTTLAPLVLIVCRTSETLIHSIQISKAHRKIKNNDHDHVYQRENDYHV